MYETIINEVCDECHKETNLIEFEKWKSANQELYQQYYHPTNQTFFSKKFIEKLKNSGHYGWKHEKQKVVHIEADCHGDAKTLCLNHFQKWSDDIILKLKLC